MITGRKSLINVYCDVGIHSFGKKSHVLVLINSGDRSISPMKL